MKWNMNTRGTPSTKHNKHNYNVISRGTVDVGKKVSTFEEKHIFLLTEMINTAM